MKRSLAILATLVLALGAVGVGYAAWTSSITIHGTVTTGTLSWEWQPGAFLALSGFDSSSPATPVSVVATIPGYPTTNTDMVVTVDKVYPGWMGYFTLKETNTGNLPLQFQSFELQSTAGSGFAPYYQIAFYTPAGPAAYTIGPAVVGVNNCNYVAWISNIDGTPQPYGALIVDVAPGVTHSSICSLYLDQSVPAWMNTAYSFTFTHTATVALP